jgi:glycosyltransferase involved in cell wall biosynthesis|tara:strand:- start:26472 stop:27227 length:756 start_codon:yes stop_codon:yes gene_type:complete
LNPRVTIATICFNSERTIEKTIRSVLSQDYLNIEYIIVDGKSTDGTMGVVEKYNSNISITISEKDSGPAEAQRKAVENSTGEYIMFLFADDWIPKNYISNAVRFLTSNKSDYVFGNNAFCDSFGKIVYTVYGDKNYAKKIKYTMPRINYTSIVSRLSIYHVSKMKDDEFKVAPDYDFLISIHNKGIVGKYCDQLTCYNQIGGNSHRKYFQGVRDVRNISIKHGANPVFAYAYYFERLVGHFCLNLLRFLNK